MYIQCNKIVFKTHHQQQCNDNHDDLADDVTKKIENGGNGHIDIFILDEDHIKYMISSWRPAPSLLPTFAQ